MNKILIATAIVAGLASPSFAAQDQCVLWKDFEQVMKERKMDYIIVDVPNALGVRAQNFLGVIYVFNGTDIMTGFIDANGCVSDAVDLGPAKPDTLS